MSQVYRIQNLLDVLCDLIYEVLQSRNVGYNPYSNFHSESTCEFLITDVELYRFGSNHMSFQDRIPITMFST